MSDYIVIVMMIVVFLLPSIIAFCRDADYSPWVVALNSLCVFFNVWLLAILWAGALILSFIKNKRSKK